MFDCGSTERVLWKIIKGKVGPGCFRIFLVVNKVKEMAGHGGNDVKRAVLLPVNQSFGFAVVFWNLALLPGMMAVDTFPSSSMP